MFDDDLRLGNDDDRISRRRNLLQGVARCSRPFYLPASAPHSSVVISTLAEGALCDL